MARDIERRKAKTHDHDILADLDLELAPFTALMNSDWYRLTSPRRTPRLTDFVTVEHAEKIMAQFNRDADSAPEREYDQKFHILFSSSSFEPDVDRFRDAAILRGLPFAIAFLDIDNFKAFNTKYTEPVVDSTVLPVFMRRVEAHVYGRGHAYLEGGDECMILLHNVSRTEALNSMEQLRQSVQNLRFRGVPESITVSIGVVHAEAECVFTTQELETRAATAKAGAKQAGRNCIAAFRDTALTDLHVFDPTA